MKVKLVNILEESFEDRMKIREWRNSEVISKQFLIPYIEEETHRNWLKSMEAENPKTVAFFIVADGEKVGLTYFHSIDRINKTAEAGSFLSPDALGKYLGIGAISGYLSVEFAFNVLKMEKLNIEVLETNKKILVGNKKSGYKPEGIRRGNIVKNGKRLDVHLLGMFKSEWEEKRDSIYELIKGYI